MIELNFYLSIMQDVRILFHPSDKSKTSKSYLDLCTYKLFIYVCFWDIWIKYVIPKTVKMVLALADIKRVRERGMPHCLSLRFGTVHTLYILC